MKETPIIYSKRLLLRPFSLLDANDVYEWCSSLAVTKYLFWYPHRNIEVTKRLLIKWTRQKRNYSWCLVYQGKAIGEVEVIKDLPCAGFEIGYTLNENYWRKGFMKEALQCVFSFLFLKKDYKYAFAITDKRNVPSKMLLESLGFLLEKKEEESGDYFIAKKNEHIQVTSYRYERESFLIRENAKNAEFPY